MYRLGVDIGGTFTDALAVNEETGEILESKLSTTPEDPSIGFLRSVEKILGKDLSKVSTLIHSSTITTNIVVTRSGAKVGLVTTKGFRDLLEIGRGNRKHSYDLRWIKPAPLVPRYLRKEVDGRVNYSGKVIEQLDEDGARRVARELKKEDVESVAVCFLFSYMNPKHELKMKKIIQEVTGCDVDTSYEVAPEYREFERISTVVVNSYVKPKAKRYLEELTSKLQKMNYQKKLLIMHSGGGVITVDVAATKPVLTVSSGPAAGAIGAAYIGSLIGAKNLISLDMGGTTTLVSCIYGGTAKFATEGEIEWGMPVKIPIVDVVAVGNGGGSTAWIDAGGTLRVGPESAAAYPGPACYGKGGKEPTITDACLILNILNPDYFIGGEMKIFPELARKAVKKICEHLHTDEIGASSGIRTIAIANIEQAIRAVTIERGYDPRDFSLIAFGGAGPMFAVDVAKNLSIPSVIIPMSPGITSALGVTVADIRHDYARSRLTLVKSLSLEEINQIFKELRENAFKDFEKHGIGSEAVYQTSFDLRYLGESYEINIPLASRKEGATAIELEDTLSRFHIEHDRLYGHSKPDEPVELVNFRLSAVVLAKKAVLKEQTLVGEQPVKEAFKGERDIFLEGKLVRTPLYERKFLKRGNVIHGPAIIEQMDSTILLPLGFKSIVDKYLNVVVRIT
jgi:N-methylhydantoinase A